MPRPPKEWPRYHAPTSTELVGALIDAIQAEPTDRERLAAAVAFIEHHRQAIDARTCAAPPTIPRQCPACASTIWDVTEVDYFGPSFRMQIACQDCGRPWGGVRCRPIHEFRCTAIACTSLPLPGRGVCAGHANPLEGSRYDP